MKGLLSCLLGTLMSIGVPSLGESLAQLWTPEALWKGVDVEHLPLEVERIKSWEDEGCAFEKLTYVSEIASGEKVRIFGIFGAPKGARNLPGILHIHGGGQTASPAWVQYWAKRGYACMTYDFCGKWESRTEYTDWGPLATHCNMASRGIYLVHPTPRMSGWFHWALAGRRALTLMARNPAVDPDRMGIFGISVGGTLCWLVAGTDARVKAAIPIYGCGYNVDRRKAVYGLVPSEDQLIYQAALGPEAYAPQIQCPVLFVSSSNDHHGWMDDSFDALGAVQGLTRQAFTPHYIHHIDPEQGANLQPWMDWHLKGGNAFPETPHLELHVGGEGILQARVSGALIESVVIYYAIGMKIPPSRFWRRIEPAKQADGTWTGSLPVVSAWDRVAVFANVFYRSGVCLSTRLVKTLPGQLGKAVATLRPSPEIPDCGSGSEIWFFGPAYTDPNIDRRLLRFGEDEGRRYVGVDPSGFGPQINFTIASHVFGDAQFQGPQGASLAFECKGGFDTNGLTLTFSESEWMPGGVNYRAKVGQREVTNGWRTISVPLSAFKSDKNDSPASWGKVDRIQISGVATRSEPPLFSRFRWAKP